MTAYSLTLPYKRPPLSLNARMHWAKEAQHKKALRTLAKVKARAERIPPMERAVVTLHYRPDVIRTRDAANMQPTLKPLTDGLVDAGVLSKGDSSEWVREVCEIHEPVSGQAAELWVTVEALP